VQHVQHAQYNTHTVTAVTETTVQLVQQTHCNDYVVTRPGALPKYSEMGKLRAGGMQKLEVEATATATAPAIETAETGAAAGVAEGPGSGSGPGFTDSRCSAYGSNSSYYATCVGFPVCAGPCHDVDDDLPGNVKYGNCCDPSRGGTWQPASPARDLTITVTLRNSNKNSNKNNNNTGVDGPPPLAMFARVQLRNVAASLALTSSADAGTGTGTSTDTGTDTRVLPVYYSANMVTLTPGQVRCSL
jgi:hypothetical protein